MSKLASLELKVGSEYKRSDFTDIIRALCRQIDGVSDGSIAAIHNASSAAPTTTAVTYAQGDFIRNLAPSELGSGGSKYVIAGWLCVTSGSPGTWVDCRWLTGN